MRKLATIKGAAPLAIATCFILVASFVFWYVRDAAPIHSVARSAPTATASQDASLTLGPTATAAPTPSPALTATPLPTARTVGSSTSSPTPKPPPPGTPAPHMVLSSYFVNETNCEGTLSPVSTITVTNSGGGTLTWQVSSATIELTTYGGSLAAGKSQGVTMYWDPASVGVPIPPSGAYSLNFTSNGGNAQVYIGCAGATAPVGTYTPPTTP